jgi:hypothetical protein
VIKISNRKKKKKSKKLFKLKNFLCFLFLGKYRASKIDRNETNSKTKQLTFLISSITNGLDPIRNAIARGPKLIERKKDWKKKGIT